MFLAAEAEFRPGFEVYGGREGGALLSSRLCTPALYPLLLWTFAEQRGELDNVCHCTLSTINSTREGISGFREPREAVAETMRADFFTRIKGEAQRCEVIPGANSLNARQASQRCFQTPRVNFHLFAWQQH